MIDNDVELIVASRTQTPETLQKLMEDDGYDVETSVLSDQPAESAPATEQTPPAKTDSPVPPTEPGSEAAGPSEGENKTDSEPVQSQEQHEPRKSGSSKLKRKLQERDATIGELEGSLKSKDDEITELKRRLENPSAPAPTKTDPPPAAEQPAPAAEPKPKPTLDDFADEEDPYLALSEALVDWKLEQRQATAQPPATRPAPAETAIPPAVQQARADAWKSEIDGAKAEFPDFETAINKDHGKPVCNPVMTDAVQQLKGGGKLVYWLATHPDEANRIHELTAPSQSDTPYTLQQKFATAIAEIARINLGTPAPPAQQQQPPATQQPPAAAPKSKPTPPSTVGSRGTPGYRTLRDMSEQEIRDMDMLEFERRRNAGELS